MRGTGDALAEFTTALKRDNTSRFRNNLGVYYLDKRQVPEAIDELTRAVRLDRYNDIAYNALGVALLQSAQPGALAEAGTSLGRAVSIKEHPIALNNLGTVSLLQGKTDEAQEKYQRAAQLDPADAAVANNLGVSYLKQAKYEPAIEQFLTAIQTAANDSTAYCNLGLIYVAKPELRDLIRQRVQSLSLQGVSESSTVTQRFVKFLDEVGSQRPEQFEQSCGRFEQQLKAAFPKRP
jgi:Flp pilus assembly protein TadD